MSLTSTCPSFFNRYRGQWVASEARTPTPALRRRARYAPPWRVPCSARQSPRDPGSGLRSLSTRTRTLWHPFPPLFGLHAAPRRAPWPSTTPRRGELGPSSNSLPCVPRWITHDAWITPDSRSSRFDPRRARNSEPRRALSRAAAGMRRRRSAPPPPRDPSPGPPDLKRTTQIRACPV